MNPLHGVESGVRPGFKRLHATFRIHYMELKVHRVLLGHEVDEETPGIHYMELKVF